MSELALADTALSMDHLLSQYTDWVAVVQRGDCDDFGTVAMMANLYRFAITNYDRPGIELLHEALKVAEATAPKPMVIAGPQK